LLILLIKFPIIFGKSGPCVAEISTKHSAQEKRHTDPPCRYSSILVKLLHIYAATSNVSIL